MRPVSTPDIAVEVQGVSVVYGAATVLDAVSISIPNGEWTAIVGRNGAGKSSLLASIVGTGQGSERVRFPGRSGSRARFLAFVPQTPVLPPGMTVAEYVLLGRTAHLGWFRNEGRDDRSRARDAMDQLQLLAFAGRLLSELSGGEAQRVVLARALCQDADILILDEPTTSLDLGRQLEVLELVKELAASEHLTVVSAIHDLTAAARYADQVVVLDEGRVAAAGPPDETLQPDLLSRHFGTTLHRLQSPDGYPIIIAMGSGTGARHN